MSLKKPHVRTIIIPCLGSDQDNLRFLLSSWEDPRLHPVADGAKPKKRTLMVVLNNADQGLIETFEAICRDSAVVQQVFSEVVVKSAGLVGDADLYAKNAEVAKGAYGNKAGPNNLFFAALDFAASRGGFALQCEVDCFPLAPGWLTRLDRLTASNPEAWVLGSHYTGLYPLHDSIRYHINGNAIYHVGDAGFQDFARNVWRPRLQEFTRKDPNLAYDCWWAIEMHRASPQLRNKSWMLTIAYGHRFVALPFIINLLHKETLGEDLQISATVAQLRRADFILIHASFMQGEVRAFLETGKPGFLEHLEGAYAVGASGSEKLLADIASGAGAAGAVTGGAVPGLPGVPGLTEAVPVGAGPQPGAQHSPEHWVMPSAANVLTNAPEPDRIKAGIRLVSLDGVKIDAIETRAKIHVDLLGPVGEILESAQVSLPVFMGETFIELRFKKNPLLQDSSVLKVLSGKRGRFLRFSVDREGKANLRRLAGSVLQAGAEAAEPRTTDLLLAVMLRDWQQLKQAIAGHCAEFAGLLGEPG